TNRTATARPRGAVYWRRMSITLMGAASLKQGQCRGGDPAIGVHDQHSLSDQSDHGGTLTGPSWPTPDHQGVQLPGDRSVRGSLQETGPGALRHAAPPRRAAGRSTTGPS